MSDFEVKFNTTELLAGAEAAFKDANMILGREFQKRITSNTWQWPSEPSPRDIVDTGQLRDSYTPTALSKTEHEHAWNTEYAMAVHEGAVMEAAEVSVKSHWRTMHSVGGREIAPRSTKLAAYTRQRGASTMPARPWVRVTLREFDFAGAYGKLAQSELARVKDPP